MRARRLLAVLSVSILLLAGAARGGEMRPCSDPTVFEGAALNALVLPYRFDGPASPPAPELQAASRQISALVHLELLMGLLKYGSVGAKDLLAEPGRVCDVDEVLAQVTRTSARGALRQGQVLLLLWGRLFEQRGELYVQSYVRFLRQGSQGPEPELLGFTARQGQSQLVLAAGLPSQALAFAPRRISRAELARVDREFRQAMVLRERPEAGAPGRSIDFSPQTSFPYWVSEARGDWMLIKPMQGGPAGWVQVRGDYGGEGEAPWSLRRWLPELAYADALAGFMRMRAGRMPQTELARAQQAVERGLARYEATVPAELAPGPWGLAAALRGWLDWEAGRRGAALERFEQSEALMPSHGGARQLLAAARLAEQGLSRDSAAGLSAELVGALALAPDDQQVLGNLDRLYALYAQRPDWSLFEPALLKQRQAIVRAGLKKKAPY